MLIQLTVDLRKRRRLLTVTLFTLTAVSLSWMKLPVKCRAVELLVVLISVTVSVAACMLITAVRLL